MASGSTKIMVVSIGVIVALTVIGLLYVWRHHQVITMGAELGQVHDTFLKLSRENDKLRTEYEALRRSREVLRTAEDKLNMEPLTPARVIEVPGTPAPVQAARQEAAQ